MVAYGGVRWVAVWLMLVIGMDFLWWWPGGLIVAGDTLKCTSILDLILTSDDPTITIYCS